MRKRAADARARRLAAWPLSAETRSGRVLCSAGNRPNSSAGADRQRRRRTASRAGSIVERHRVGRLGRQQRRDQVERPLRDEQRRRCRRRRASRHDSPSSCATSCRAAGADRQPHRHLAGARRRRAPAAGWRCSRRRSAARTPVTPSSSVSGAFASRDTLLWPRLPGSSRIGFALNRAIVCVAHALLQRRFDVVDDRADTALHRRRAPARSRRPASAARTGRPSSCGGCRTPSNGCEKPRIVIGTNTSGLTPSVVPSNPRGATPTIVIVWPLTMSGWFEHAGIGAEARLPVGVAEHDDVRFAERAVVVRRRAGGRAPAAGRAPESSCRRPACPSPFCVWPRAREVGAERHVRGDAGERRLHLLEVAEHRVAEDRRRSRRPGCSCASPASARAPRG